MQVNFGQWPGEPVDSKVGSSFTKKVSLDPVYAYIVLADKKTGFCSCYKFEVDQGDDIIVAKDIYENVKERSNCYDYN